MLAMFVPINVLCICLLGFFTSYTDLKKGAIRNKAVFPAMALGIALNLLNAYPLPEFFLNGFLAFLFGFVLWTAGLWSAGDAKLFLAFALLFPLPLHASTSFFPAFAILVNSFVPAFAFMLAIVLLRTSKRQKLDALKSAFTPKTAFPVAAFLLAFYWLLNLILPLFPFTLDFFTVAILIFILVSCVEFFLPAKSTWIFAAIALLFIILNPAEFFEPGFLLFFFSMLLAMLLLLFFVLRLGLSCFGKPVKIHKLKPGMVLLETVVERKGTLEKKKSFLPSFVNILSEAKEKSPVETGPKGLSIEDVNLLKRAKANTKARFETLLVQETLPFAPIIFAGTILSFFSPLFFMAPF